MPHASPRDNHPSRFLPRRRFLQRTLAGLTLPACGVWTESPARAAQAPGDRLRIGAIGVGNRGNDNLADVRPEELVAVCDVDARYLQLSSTRFPQARSYRDLRELIDRETLDALIISTPDHMHAYAAWHALRRGWHVYCERPLTRSLGDIRTLQQAAAAAGVATQMGNQHHSSEGYETTALWLRSGVLGKILSIHAWTVKPNWPQGVPRPAGQPPVPDHLAWDLWLGVAPERPYHPDYHPFLWRGRWDFGTGTLGDVAVHLLDPVVWGLELGAPKAVLAEGTGANDESLPKSSIVRWVFPATDQRPELPLTWYDGGHLPPHDVTGGARLPPQGVLVIGERGRIFIPELGRMPQVQPAELRREMPGIVNSGERLSHVRRWLDACRGGPPANSDFGYGGRLSELCLLGNVALRVGRPLNWLSDVGRFAGDDEANRWLTAPPPRAGWEWGPA